MKRMFDLLDDMAWNLDWWSLPNASNGFNTVRKLRVYDPEKYDLVEKESFKKEIAEAKEKQLKELEKQIEQVRGEIKALKK